MRGGGVRVSPRVRVRVRVRARVRLGFGAGQFSLETLVGGRSATTISQNPRGGGRGGGGGLGGVAYKDRAQPPPRVWGPTGEDVAFLRLPMRWLK